MRIRALLVAALAALGTGCPRTNEASAPLVPLPPATTDTSQDPLRMPPELHLRHVRQLSFGGRAFAPVFSRDGKRLAFLSVPAASPAPDAGAPLPVAHLLDLHAGRNAVELLPAAPAAGALADLWLSPAGDLCGDVATTPCSAPAAGPCPIEATRELGAGRCAPPHWPLSRSGPCAATAAGDWACLLIAASGTQLWLWPAGATTGHPLDRRSGEDADPVFSAKGNMLSWSSTRGETPGAPGGRVPTGIEVLAASQFSKAPPPEPPSSISPPGQANQRPSLFPEGDRLVFASNADDAAGRDMDIFVIAATGQDLERITFAPGADIDPALSPDGHQIAWVSERNAAAPGEQDLLIADWVE
jgi:TolB protein